MITKAEEIGQHAVEIFRQNLPTRPMKHVRWILRELTGRDFGIDLAAEVFVGKESTGRVLFFQIKGRKDAIPWDDNGYFAYSHKVNNLLYAEKFNIPFILCFVELASSNVYWIWMQKYIQLILDRDSSWRNQKNKQVVFSKKHLFSETISTLTHIAGHPQRLSYMAALSGYTKESRTRLGAFTDAISIHLDEDFPQYPLEYCKKEFPLLKHYLEQVTINPIWNEKDFQAGQLAVATSINPMKECLRNIETFIETGFYPSKQISTLNVVTPVEAILDRENVGPFYLMSQLHFVDDFLNNIESMITMLNDVRFQRDMMDFEQDKSI
jgi:hypothetical protein